MGKTRIRWYKDTLLPTDSDHRFELIEYLTEPVIIHGSLLIRMQLYISTPLFVVLPFWGSLLCTVLQPTVGRSSL